MKRRRDIRVILVIGSLTLLGAATALLALASTHGLRDETVIRPLVWTVFATPFATFIGWLLARRERAWQAAFTCFMIYFFSIFLAARIERLLLGGELALERGHLLYFQLTVVFNVLSGCVVALREGRSRSTILANPTATQSMAEGEQGGRATSSQRPSNARGR